jgi:ribosomal protein L35AE/L33A
VLFRRGKELYKFKQCLVDLDTAFRSFEKALLGNIIFYSTRNANREVHEGEWSIAKEKPF